MLHFSWRKRRISVNNRILFLYNAVSTEEKMSNTILGECASPLTVAEVFRALQETGSEVFPLNLRSPQQLEECIRESDPFQMAFVTAEGFLDMPETLYDGTGAMLVRRLLGENGIPYTHSCPEGMRKCRNKDLTYKALSDAGIDVPAFTVICPKEDVEYTSKIERLEETVGYPFFVKPVGGGSSICIDRNSVVANRNALFQRVKMIGDVLGGHSVLVEKHLAGREYTIGVLASTEKYVLPVVAFPVGTGVRSALDKFSYRQSQEGIEILEVASPKGRFLAEMALRVFDALGTRDLIRIDIKEDDSGRAYVIDVNGTPSISPNSSIATMACAAGLEHRELVGVLLYSAMAREGIPVSSRLMESITGPMLKIRTYHSSMVA